jgi:ComEC/Rec2-related protein
MEERFSGILLRLYLICLVPVLAFLGFTGASVLRYPLFFLVACFVFMSMSVVCFPSCINVCFRLTVFSFLALLLTMRGEDVSSFVPGCRTVMVTGIEGVAISDEKETSGGNMFVQVRTSLVASKDGGTFSCRGTVCIFYGQPVEVQVGDRLSAEGKVTDIGFKAGQIQVLRKGLVDWQWWLDLFRTGVQHQLLRRIPVTLGRLLLLGRCDQEGFPIKEAALKCGCAHLLALSGMHLSVLTLIFSFLPTLLFGPYLGRRLSLVFPLCFTIVAGPLPSLVRALLMNFLAVIIGPWQCYAREKVFGFSFVVQLLLFPYAIGQAGTLLSYGAVGALLCMALLLPAPSPLSGILLPTLFALLFVYPLSECIGGEWTMAALVSAPAGGLLITFALALALFCLMSSCLPFPVVCLRSLRLLAKVQDVLLSLFSWSVRVKLYIPACYSGRWGYRCFALTLLTSLAVYLYACKYLRNRRYRAYELELSLRIPHGDTGYS